MGTYPEEGFLPRPDHSADMGQFPEPALPAVSANTWRELMELAVRFRQLEPWQMMADNELFGIRDPECRSLYLVSVLGGTEGVFAIHCHMPPEGTIFWQNAFRGIDVDMVPGLAEIRLLECEFLDTEDAADEDASCFEKYFPKAKKLKLQKGLPCFRSYLPGFFPWFLDQGEADYMVRVFRLFFRFYEEILPQRKNFYQWDNPFGEMPGIPIFSAVDGQPGPPCAADWQVKMEVLPSECLAPLTVDPDLDPELEELVSYPLHDETWEVGSFYMPTPLVAKERPHDRPYYPKSAVCMREGLIGSRCPCDPVIYGGEEDNCCDTAAVRQAFKDMAAHCQYLPERVRVDSEVTYAALEAYAMEFEIQLTYEAQVLMPGLITEIVTSLEDEQYRWEESLLKAVVDAIPVEFRHRIAIDDVEGAVQELAETALEGQLADTDEQDDGAGPANVIFADFAGPNQ